MGGRGASGGGKGGRLPELTGTEKQVNWAKDIRESFLADIAGVRELENWWWKNSDKFEKRLTEDQKAIRRMISLTVGNFYTAEHGESRGWDFHLSESELFEKSTLESVVRKGDKGSNRYRSFLSGTESHKNRLNTIDKIEKTVRNEKNAKWFIDRRSLTQKFRYKIVNGKMVAK